MKRDKIQIRLDSIDRINRNVRTQMILLDAAVVNLRREYDQFLSPLTPPPLPRYRGTTAEGEPQRPRGRPRKDGLMPGSVEAKEADRKKEEERLVNQEIRRRKRNR